MSQINSSAYKLFKTKSILRCTSLVNSFVVSVRMSAGLQNRLLFCWKEPFLWSWNFWTVSAVNVEVLPLHLLSNCVAWLHIFQHAVARYDRATTWFSPWKAPTFLPSVGQRSCFLLLLRRVRNFENKLFMSFASTYAVVLTMHTKDGMFTVPLRNFTAVFITGQFDKASKTFCYSDFCWGWEQKSDKIVVWHTMWSVTAAMLVYQNKERRPYNNISASK